VTKGFPEPPRFERSRAVPLAGSLACSEPPRLSATAVSHPSMLRHLGIGGIIGLFLLVGGIAIIAWESLIIASGLAIAIAGLGLIVRALVSSALGAMGMGGLV